MGFIKRRKTWLVLLAVIGLAGLTGCNGGGLSVGYAPAVVCGSVDFDPGECRR